MASICSFRAFSKKAKLLKVINSHKPTTSSEKPFIRPYPTKETPQDYENFSQLPQAEQVELNRLLKTISRTGEKINRSVGDPLYKDPSLHPFIGSQPQTSLEELFVK